MCIWGVLHTPKRVPAPGIVFCHGFTGTRVESHQLFVHAARHLCERGFVILRFDFRGSGESEGLFQDMTISGEVEDLKTAISWILRRKGVIKDKIGVNGLSLGGVVTMLTAATDPRVKAVSLWSTPSELSGFKQVEPGLPHRLLEQGYVDLSSGHRIGKAFLMDLSKHRITEAVSEIAPRPLLIVHGTKDEVVTLWHAERLYEAAGEPKEKFFVEGADHTYKRWDWQWTVIRRTADWFEKNLHP